MTQLSVPVEDDPLPFSPSALTLSFGGVEFALTPSNKDAVVSYRNEGQGVTLTLTNFTGSFQVVQKGTSMPFPVSSYTSTAAANNKVEEDSEPNSPQTRIHNRQKVISPGQQKLTFGNNKNSSKVPAVRTKNPNPKPKAARKKVMSSIDTTSHTCTTPKARPNNNNSQTTYESSPMLPLGQTMPDPSQMDSTQNADINTTTHTHTHTHTQNHTPDLSQTMDTAQCSANDDDGSSSKPASEMCRIPSTTDTVVLEGKPKASVQEILDRVNNSDESVATLKYADDTSIKSVESEKTSHFQVVDQGGTDPMDTTTSSTNDDGVAGTGDANKQEPPSTTTCLAPTQTTPVAPEPEPVSFQGYPPPCPRWGHTMTKIKDDRMLVYGGQSFDVETGDPIILSDVHVYNTAKRTWDKPINCKGEARQWHSATFLPERELLLTFGGESMEQATTTTNNNSKKNNKKDKVVTTDMLRVLDTDIMLWYPPAVSGEVPTGRSGHTATWMPNTNEVVLFGGCIKGKKWLHSVSILDTVRWIWSTPSIQGVAPKSRSYHSATAVRKLKSVSSRTTTDSHHHDQHHKNDDSSSNNNSYKLVIFGGNNQSSCFNTLHVLEQDTSGVWRWSNPKPTGQAPFPRTGHSATLLEDGKTICIYGGWDPNEEAAATTTGDDQHQENIFKASYLLDTEHMSWRVGPKAVYDCGSNSGNDNQTTQADDCGAKRCGHKAVLHPESGEVLVFGGRVPGERLADDFYKLSPAERLVGFG